MIARSWAGPERALATEPAAMHALLRELDAPCYVVDDGGRLAVTAEGEAAEGGGGDRTLLAALAPLPPEALGDAAFRAAHGVRLAYAAGAMANGVACEELVAALGRARLLGSFGAAGLAPARIAAAVEELRRRLPDGPFACNLIHTPEAPAREREVVELYLGLGVRTVEASAFMDVTPALVHYRAAGIEAGPGGEPLARNRVVAKVSRPALAERMMRPPPDELLRELVAAGRISEAQARAAAMLPLAGDVTAEADSGGHTDRQPLVGLLPALVALRDRVQAERRYPERPRVGAAGGIATPAAVAAAFTLGADYVVTGSINQSCREAATSAAVKALLAAAEPTDVAMAPAADMFELGVQVQVLKRGTLFPMRARRLYELYAAHGSLEELPAAERERLERELFRQPLDEVWEDTRAWFSERDPALLARAEADPKQKLALVFRSYLGRSSDWAARGEPGRETDYQVWCGPSMGAFNAWSAGTPLADPAGRGVVEVAFALAAGAAYLLRLQALRAQGVVLPPAGGVATPAPAPARRARRAPDAAAIEEILLAQVAAQLGIDPDEIDVRRELAAYALTSAQALVVLARLEEELGRRLSPTLAWNYPTIEALAAHLARTES